MAIAKKKKSNKGLFVAILIGLLVLVVIGTSMIKTGDTGNYQSVPVIKETVTTYYTFSGSVGSKNTQSVMAEKIMQISEIKVSEGTKVKRDDLLFTTTDGTEIKAKIDGTVSQIFVEPDEQLMSGALLCEIYDFENLEVTIKVDEYDLPAITVGKELEVTINALDKKVTGTVSTLSDTATNQNGIAFFTATVDIVPDSEIKIGMTAEAKILNKQAIDTLTIPLRALMFDSENNPYVYTKDDKGVMTKTTVIVGINDGKTVEITSGVLDAETIYYSTASAEQESGGGFMPPVSN